MYVCLKRIFPHKRMQTMDCDYDIRLIGCCACGKNSKLFVYNDEIKWCMHLQQIIFKGLKQMFVAQLIYIFYTHKYIKRFFTRIAIICIIVTNEMTIITKYQEKNVYVLSSLDRRFKSRNPLSIRRI